MKTGNTPNTNNNFFYNFFLAIAITSLIIASLAGASVLAGLTFIMPYALAIISSLSVLSLLSGLTHLATQDSTISPIQTPIAITNSPQVVASPKATKPHQAQPLSLTPEVALPAPTLPRPTIGLFASQPSKQHKGKLIPNGLEAIFKISDDNDSQWYWVGLKFVDKSHRTAFKQHFNSHKTKYCYLKFQDYYGDDTQLDVELIFNSPAYKETLANEDKTGIIILRELDKLMDITNIAQHFVNEHRQLIPSNKSLKK